MLSRAQKNRSICQIADAMKYIHSHKIKHLNLKPSNIYFSEDDDIFLIGDFYKAQRYVSDDQIEQKEDIYSYDSIVYFIISEGKMPHNKYAPIGYPSFLSELIEACLSNESDVTFEMISQGLKEVDFENDWEISNVTIENF